MNLVAAVTYWAIVILWLTVLAAIAISYVRDPKVFGTTRLLLSVLAIDALRNIIENVYFGLFFGSQYGILPADLAVVLGNPVLLVIPKLVNITAGCLVLGLLLLRWLPMAVSERTKTEQRADYFQEKAAVDQMTGLYNRSHFLEVATAEWDRYRRYKRPLSLLMLDIDRFKSINDRHGHGVGDEVIVQVAEICKEHKRRSDVVARLGGDEFVVLLPETSLEDARIAAGRLRQAIADRVVRAADIDVSVTVTIGLSDARQSTGIIDMMKQADIALYEAKRMGRNTICAFGGTASNPNQSTAA